MVNSKTIMLLWVILSCHLFAQTDEKSGDISIILVGDSTVTDNTGWGAGFKACLSEKAKCTVLASEDLTTDGFWQEVLNLKPTYALIQFGQAEKKSVTNAAIEQRIDQLKSAGIEVILVTPLSCRQWGPDNHIESSLKPFADRIKSVAAQKKIPQIDLHDRSIEVYESLGKDGCDMLAPAKDDGRGINAAGGNLFGSLVAAELKVSIKAMNSFFPTSKLMELQKTMAPQAKADPAYIKAMTQPQAASLTDKGAKTLTVASDGSGDFKTVQSAIAAVPDNNSARTVIYIKPGVYMGPIILPPCKPNVTFEGQSKETCILTYALNTHDPVPANTLPKMAGNGVIILADNFQAQNLTFRNTSGDHGQAMALRIEGDKAIVKDCLILGWQDTLLLNNGRHYFKNCTIEGRVDFIYGSATAVFDDCLIRTKMNSYITAASTPQEKPYGFVFRHCTITSPDGTLSYLGRPWKPYASVTFMDCSMGAQIRPEGWQNWKNTENEKTARYAEYQSTGPGANPKGRVPWSSQLTIEEAKKYTLENIFSGWNPKP